ncbi:MAG: flagellar protein FlgN [bacterium]|nr:flagellar protein FlgN [bacterium]
MSDEASLSPALPMAVVNECLALLVREERAIEPALAALRELRSALVAGDMTQVSELLSQESSAEPATDMTASRAQFRRRVGTLLSLPQEEVTVRRIAEWASPEQREQLLERRKRVAELANEVDFLGRANAALLRQSMDMLNMALSQITGGGSSDCYDPSGRVANGVTGSIIQTDC